MVQGPAPNSPEASRPTKRLVAFGRFAGMAGVLDSFTAIGKRLLYSRVSGTSSPFLASVGPAWMYDSVDSAKDSVRRLGELILEEGIPVPVVLAITGQGGCVHNGAMEILTLLPHEVVPVSLLPQLQQNFQSNPNSRHRAVYLVPVGISEAFERKDGMSFDRQDFQKHPELYRSVFAKNVAPFVNVIYNCAYWDARFPRLLTKAQLKCLYERDGPKSSLFLAADISCDVSGSMEVPLFGLVQNSSRFLLVSKDSSDPHHDFDCFRRYSFTVP
jgi:alpha-aminoadipic semialdehyde synthase